MRPGRRPTHTEVSQTVILVSQIAFSVSQIAFSVSQIALSVSQIALSVSHLTLPVSGILMVSQVSRQASYSSPSSEKHRHVQRIVHGCAADFNISSGKLDPLRHFSGLQETHERF